MKLKKLHYMFILPISLLIVTINGYASSLNKEKINEESAMYISLEELKSQKEQSKEKSTTLDFIRGSGRIDDILPSKKNRIFVNNLSLGKLVRQWLTANGLHGKIVKVSSDQSRVIVEANEGVPHSDKVLILDTSDKWNIQKLASREHSRHNGSVDYKIKKGDYILILRALDLLIYDYKSGKLLSFTHLSRGYIAGVEYILVKENEIFFIDNYPEALKKIDFTDRRNPIVTVIAERCNYSYKLSKNHKNLYLNDKNGNFLAKVTMRSDILNTQNSINRWLKNNVTWSRAYPQTVDTLIVQGDHTRAISTRTTGWRSGALDLFDIGNHGVHKLNSIDLDMHYHFLEKVLFKCHKYIVVATSQKLIIFDYTSGDILSSTELLQQSMDHSVNYLSIGTNSAVFSYRTYQVVNNQYQESIVKKKIDYSDPSNPIITVITP